jgi:DNA-directed RNA polymerase subunit M/transcription elongation factor TFIIS
MNFCTQCGNMYYIKIKNEGDNSLIYYCRKCGFEDNSISQDGTSLCVSKTHISGEGGSKNYSQVINKYTKLDPTLPRINTVKCPNVKCATNNNEGKDDDKKHEVIYLRYDDIKLKYIYLCPTCDHIWKT